MTPNRITFGGARAGAATLAAVLAFLGATVTGCGGGDRTTGTTAELGAAAREAIEGRDPENVGDIKVLTGVIERQLGAAQVLEALAPPMEDVASQQLVSRFRNQEGEHADGTTEVLRELVRPAPEVEPESIAIPQLKDDYRRFLFIYELESHTLAFEEMALRDVVSEPARALLAATVADQAGRLAVVRQHIGANEIEANPEPFDTGKLPPPGEMP